jgi:signal transduction histidine kinase/PAS domain-containing protein
MTAEVDTETRAPSSALDGASGSTQPDTSGAPPGPPRRARKPRARPHSVEIAQAGESLAPAPDHAATPIPAPRRKRASTTTTTPHETSEIREPPQPARARRTSAGARRRESGILGLTERAQALPERQTLFTLPDALLLAAPTIRKALLDGTLESASQGLVETLALTLAPAIVTLWIVQPTPWAGNASRVGGVELSPSLRLRAHAAFPGELRQTVASDLSRDDGGMDPLVEEVVTSRQSVVIHDALEHPLAREWTPMFFGASTPLATLAAYPLRARGQLLGVLAVGAGARLTARQIATVVELSDLTALSADRDRLLAYSRSHDALAQTVVRHAPVAMALVIGADYLLALANPAFAELLGVESDAPLAGKRLAEVVGDRADAIAATLRLDAAYAGDEPQAMVELPIHRSGRMTYWNVTISPLVGAGAAGGALVAAVEVTRQVLARQRAQESADLARERVRQMTALHATSLAVASQLGADPHELLADLLRRSIELLSARAGAIYMLDARHDTLEVSVCQGLRGDYTGSRIPSGAGIVGQVARTGKGMIVDDYRAYPFRAAIYDNEPFTAIMAAPLVAHGRVVGVLDILDDGGRRTFTEEDLRLLELFAAQAAQAAENARTYVELERAYRKQRDLDRLKDDFIATASHELRTPLTGVQGFLELLLDLPAAQADPLMLEFGRRAADSAQELVEIAERLLQTARLDTGRLDLHSSPVRLAPVVERVLGSFGDLQAAQGNQHTLQSDVPMGVVAQADLGRLKEVLDNLVSNAIKYSPPGSEISVRCAPAPFGLASRAPVDALLHDMTGESLADAPERFVDGPTVALPIFISDDDDVALDPTRGACQPARALLEAAETRPYVVLTVRDQGIGVPEHERSRLFGRFSRLDAARVSQARGAGLGLYICRQLARAMGGDVWLHESEPGRGSVFAVALPALARPTT